MVSALFCICSVVMCWRKHDLLLHTPFLVALNVSFLFSEVYTLYTGLISQQLTLS